MLWWTQDFCKSQKYPPLPDGGTDYAISRPCIQAVTPERSVYWGAVDVARQTGAFQDFVLPDGSFNHQLMEKTLRADYDARIVEFYKRWEVQHAQDKTLSNNFEHSRRTLGNLAELQGWYSKYPVRSDIKRSRLYDIEFVEELAKRLKDVEATRNQM